MASVCGCTCLPCPSFAQTRQANSSCRKGRLLTNSLYLSTATAMLKLFLLQFSCFGVNPVEIVWTAFFSPTAIRCQRTPTFSSLISFLATDNTQRREIGRQTLGGLMAINGNVADRLENDVWLFSSLFVHCEYFLSSLYFSMFFSLSLSLLSIITSP